MTRLELLEIAKPILFNTEMVRAIQNGDKTVTRRPLKPHNAVKAKKCGYEQGSGLWYDDTFNEGDKDTHIKDYSVSCCWIGTKIYIQKYAPYKVGDYLYVRETWATTKSNACIANELGNCPHKSCDTADGTCFADEYIYKTDDLSRTDVKWHSSIHMPKEAARIFLRITDVRVERLQDITEDGVCEEGAEPLIQCPNERTIYYPDGGMETCYNTSCCKPCYFDKPYSELFGKLVWNSTVKKSDLDKYGWDANPWVFVIGFEKLEVE